MIFGKEGLDTKENCNIITLPFFTPHKASMMSPYLNLSIKLNSTYLFTVYIVKMAKIKSSMIDNLKSKSEALSEWDTAIEKIKEDVVKDIEETLPHYDGGRRPVTIDNTYIQHFTEEILDLKPIKISTTDGNELPDYVDVENLFNEIKNEVKKGNRLSFKLMQELQATIEGLTAQSVTSDKDLIDHALVEYENKVDSFLMFVVKAVDSMDIIYKSALKADLNEWAVQIETVLADFLKQLETFGIEETEAEGKFFEGESMISIGTVPGEYAPHLKRFQVYSVHERGFRFKETGKLIREAKVTTIY
jgi:molecular chaperone GrpE (heat shock protein)